MILRVLYKMWSKNPSHYSYKCSYFYFGEFLEIDKIGQDYIPAKKKNRIYGIRFE
jgi:hypothetical protein